MDFFLTIYHQITAIIHSYDFFTTIFSFLIYYITIKLIICNSNETIEIKNKNRPVFDEI